MKAVRIHEYGGPEQLRWEEDVPEPAVMPQTVLIESIATSINPIDWKVRSGARQKDFPLVLPAILGRDVSGVVRAVGGEVRHVKPGDRVLALTNAAYAELVAVEESRVTHSPEGVDLVDAAGLPLIALTGDQLVRRAAGIVAGQRVLVTGAVGAVGRAAVHSALKMGARVIAGVRGAQLQEAAALHAHDVVAIDDADAVAQLAPLDAIADTVGGEAVACLLKMLREGGRLGYASVLPEDTAARHPGIVITRVFAQPDPSKVREFADDFRDGTFKLPIGRRLPLRQAAEGHVLAERGGIGKIILLARPA